MSALGTGWWPYAFILVAGFAATDFWRCLGVFLSVRLDETSQILVWVKAVSTALVAGLVSRLVIFPVGELAHVPDAIRLAAVAVGVVVFLAARRNMLIGIAAGEAVLLAGIWLARG